MPGSAGDFYERGKKLESLAKLMPIDALGNDILVVRDDPAQLVCAAVTPQDSADWPYVGLRTTMWARTNGHAPIERKRNHIVWSRGHDRH